MCLHFRHRIFHEIRSLQARLLSPLSVESNFYLIGSCDDRWFRTGGSAWVGSSTPSASTTTAHTCNDWSTNSDIPLGFIGGFPYTDGWWNDGAQNPCDFSNQVYCLEE